jgi:hypothetical protein
MHILGIVGSFRKNGNTARIVQTVGKHLEGLAADAGQPLTFYGPHRAGRIKLALVRLTGTAISRWVS